MALPVVINGRYLVQRLTGVQRYAREIAARMGDRARVVAPGNWARGTAGHLWEQTILPLRSRRALLWSPSNSGPLRHPAHVVTIHDCACFDHPDSFSPRFGAWYRWLLPRLARRARRIITVSEFSKGRIIDCCGVAPERVAVIPNGVESRFRPQPREQGAALGSLRLPRPYALYVGSLEPRKNLRRLLAAWEQLAPRHRDLNLVLVGSPGTVFRDMGFEQTPPRVHLAGYLDDQGLAVAYAGAELFVYPSLYEGFGLPVLEALASGLPTVCSRTTALPEVAGQDAVLIDPEDPASIAAGMERLLDEPRLRAELRERGPRRAALFTWERAAAKTWDVLQQAACGPDPGCV